MAVQLSEAAQARIAQLIERYPTARAVMLPALHLATQEFPCLDDEVCQAVADLLQVPMVDVKGVATFYTMFPTEPQGTNEVHVCFNLSCSLKGARRLLAACRAATRHRSGADDAGRALHPARRRVHGGLRQGLRCCT